ncbi:MAG: hypothetical protein ACXU86_24710, partial [Archangium sp.]
PECGWGDGRAISMLDIEAQGEPEEEAGAQVTLTLRAAPGEAPSIRLSGSIQGQRADYELKDAPAPTFDEVWRHCLGPRVGDWDGRKLAVRFANLSDTERNAFESHIGFDSWRHPVHGTFGGFQVPHVPIRPAADLDASLWANWLLAHRTQSYVRKADFAWRCEEVQEVFTGYRLQFMTQEQLAVSLRKTAGARPGRKYWHLKEPREDSEFDRKTYEAHKALLNRLAGHVLFRTAKSFHAKVVLVDPPTGEGYLLTANLTSEALERNEEVAVRLGAEECAQVREWLAHAFWEGAEHEMATPGALEAVRASGWAPRPESRGNVLATAPGHTGLCEAFRSLVDGARGQLVVTSFGWSKEHPVVQRIILLGFQWLHAKVVWSDAGEALVTSANLEPHGMDDGFELGVRLTGRLPLRDPAVVLPVRQEAGHTAYRARGLRVPHLPQRDPPSGARGARGYGLRPRAEVTRAARGTRFTPALRAE